MSQFKGSLTGSRGTVTRLGDKQNGMAAEVNGWTVGVWVVAKHRDGQDYFEIHATGGSNSSQTRLLGTVSNGGTWSPADVFQE
jgi:hypothetical protein